MTGRRASIVARASRNRSATSRGITSVMVISRAKVAAMVAKGRPSLARVTTGGSRISAASMTWGRGMPRTYGLISGDSHLQIPPDRWTHRVPAQYRDLAPRRIRMPQGGDGVVGIGGNLVWGGTGSYAGHTPEDYYPMAPIDYDETVGSGGPEQRVKEQ